MQDILCDKIARFACRPVDTKISINFTHTVHTLLVVEAFETFVFSKSLQLFIPKSKKRGRESREGREQHTRAHTPHPYTYPVRYTIVGNSSAHGLYISYMLKSFGRTRD